MLRIMWNSRSGLNALQDKLDAISNDIANVSTTGYKKLDVSFQDLVYETLDRNGYPVEERAGRTYSPYNGTGVKDTNWLRDDTQGDLIETTSDTDLAIDGKGYFKVVSGKSFSDGSTEAYTRDGGFTIDSNGQLVDKNGNKLSVLDDNGNEINAVSPDSQNRLKITEGNLFVNTDGEVYVKENNKITKYGKIPLYGFVGNSTSMKSVGNNLFVPQNDAQRYAANGDILQKHLEKSNVDISQEITDMIIAQRAFQINSKALTTGDEMWGLVNNMKRV